MPEVSYLGESMSLSHISLLRACLVHWAGRGNCLHDLSPAAVGSDRKTSADDLSEGGQVGPDPEVFLSTAVRDPGKAAVHAFSPEASVSGPYKSVDVA